MMKTLFLLATAVVLSHSLSCNYGSSDTEGPLIRLRSKHDDTCVIHFSTVAGRPLIRYYGQYGRPLPGAVFDDGKATCVQMKDSRGETEMLCSCETERCNTRQLAALLSE